MDVDFDSIENYYEKLVYQQIMEILAESQLAAIPGALEDVACLALNQLPPRYVRHSIDATFYLGGEEQRAMLQATRQAIEKAAEFVTDHPRTE